MLSAFLNIKTYSRISLTTLAFICFTFSCRTESGAIGGETVEDLSAIAFKKQLRKEKGILIDVRTPEEYSEAHIKGALNIDISGDRFKSDINKLDKKRIYFVYCSSDNRSKTAADYMREIGFKKIYNLEGGIEEWAKRKLPLIEEKRINPL